ncbi:hypothetical protein TMU3MR103_0876 [Tetragenococcus muriaticus 3MR10-3]|uniref:Uncharacterized protein n=1 Tax=Tetragenococcus muriaticus 3MR10-3 TaxID=1302648 RepID=A0A091CDA6_9ENTE|nr:hypothetical protein TMU3MR103_0876 [Tetragenococcus muriaticus 3MR10-3]
MKKISRLKQRLSIGRCFLFLLSPKEKFLLFFHKNATKLQ